jgi:hypothetical protein
MVSPSNIEKGILQFRQESLYIMYGRACASLITFAVPAFMIIRRIPRPWDGDECGWGLCKEGDTIPFLNNVSKDAPLVGGEFH